MSPKEVVFIPYYCVIIYVSRGGLCVPPCPIQHRPLVDHQISYPNVQFETRYLSNLINHLHPRNWLAEAHGWTRASQLEQSLDPGFILQGT